MEFRLYNKFNCSFFDLIGHKEPDQTKSLGYLFAKSRSAMEAFLSIFCDKTTVRDLCKCKWIVDCEERNDEEKRADIIVRFYEGYNPIQAFILEAKSATIFSNTNSDNAGSQIQRYKNILEDFKNDIWLITLTNIVNTDGKIKDINQVTWVNLINVLYKRKNDDERINEFINYFNSIQGTMNFYDEEVMSIPFGKSQTAVEESKLYECPYAKKGSYATRANSKPLYITFREGGNNQGKMSRLYKVQDIIVLKCYDDATIDAIDRSQMYKDFKNRIIKYRELANPKDEDKFVFILDEELSFDLPNPVVFDKSYGNNGNAQNHVFLSLKDMLASPVNGQVVLNPNSRKEKRFKSEGK